MSNIPLQFPVWEQKEEDFICLGEENDSSIVMGGPYKVYYCYSKINCVQGKRERIRRLDFVVIVPSIYVNIQMLRQMVSLWKRSHMLV